MTKSKNTKKVITLRYVPKRLTKKDKQKQYAMVVKSRKMYKKHKYYTRKPVSSFHSKTSNHILDARKMYKVDVIDATNELAEKTGCSKVALRKIISKGEGAYFSSGSRPNQTAQSWGKARLASAITGGKAGAVDFTILLEGCKPGSKGLKMAKLSKKRYGYGKHRVPKIHI